MIDFITHEKCTGCAACSNACPAGAINMELNKEGFYEPVISEQNCIECGLCQQKCPQNNPEYSNTAEPKTYALMAEDNVRMHSSSGGAFELLASEMFEKSGYVCGVAYKSDFTTQHILIDNKENLHMLQGSKYIMSDVGLIYKKIGKLLDMGKKVLFSGCPCQIAGLNAYLGDKNKENLITVDLICHGIPSVTAFKKYIKDVHGNREINHIGFKEKEYGWHASMTIDFSDGERFNEPCEKDTFFWSYLSGVNKNRACGECKFAKIPRQGDITIGDYWGIGNYKKELNDGKGTSVVLLNNKKGEDYFVSIADKAKIAERTTLGSAIQGNANLIASPRNHTSRNQFFKQVSSRRFYDAAVWSYTVDRFDIGLVGIPTFPNFGGALTYYALYHTLTDMGYSTTIISRPRSSGRPPIMPEKVYDVNPYPKNALKLDFKDKDVMFTMNNVCETFIVGSDQLFNADLYYNFGEIVTLDWVTDNHRKIAYAASFGHNVFWGSENQRAKMAHYMQKFDAFSLREEEGVSLAKRDFGINAECVLDPVFLCDKVHYEKIAEDARIKSTGPHIFAYILDPDKSKNEILAYCQKKTSLNVELYSEMLFNPTEEELEKAKSSFRFPLRQAKINERLYSLIHSDLIVTDSFHGVCFAIIFNKPFIPILNTNRGASRFYTVLNKFKLANRLVTSIDDLKEKEDMFFDQIDYSDCEKILKEEKNRCMEWLKNAIEPENLIKKPFSSVDIMNEKLSVQKKFNQYMDIKMNAVLSGKVLLTISDIYSYLDRLNQYKEQFIIIIAVKDTPGFELNQKIANKLNVLGCKISLVNKHWKSYIAILDAGTIINETISKNEERVAYIGNILGKNYKVVSRSWRQGNTAAVLIDGIDYAENRRGLNIVVCDKQLNEVIDTVSFDTHMKNIPCYRMGKVRHVTVVKSDANVQNGKSMTDGNTINVPQKVEQKSSGIDKENEILLHNAMVIAAGGGCIFDYYIDKGITEVIIYGTDMLTALVWEQAYYKGIKVRQLLSDTARSFNIIFPRPGEIKLTDIHTVDLTSVNHPVIVTDISFPQKLLDLRGKGISVEKIGELNYYSHCKRFLLDKVKEYQSEFPQLKVAVCNMPHLHELKNRSEFEEKVRLRKISRKEISKKVYLDNGYSEDYVNEVWNHIEIIKKGDVNFIKDLTGKYVSAAGGYRTTTDVPSDFKQTLYMFGNSTCYGVGTDDAFTMSSVLQREINRKTETPIQYAVLNCSNGGGLNCAEQWKSIQYHMPQDGDVIILVMTFGRLVEEIYREHFIWCNAAEVLERPHNMGEIYIDDDHFSSKGYEACGKLLADTLLKNSAFLNADEIERINIKNYGRKIELNLSAAEMKQLDLYVDNLKKIKIDNVEGKKGCIVMNCNPFTLGHRYLIEESAKKCAVLYIFVVEEDQSVFPFKDRIELVKKGTADLKNVIVIPSGNFIISRTTFQAYFQKEEKNDILIDASGDINIFASKIAPSLGITVRFAGEEPFDNITNQYNATMRRLLPKFGIEFNVIPRKKVSGMVISASRVRALLAKKNFEEIRRIVPDTTYQYLYKKYFNSKNILILGGTRFMGIRLVERLLKENHFITIATRGRRKDCFGKAVTRIVYNRLDKTSVEKTLSGRYFDIVFDTSAYSSNAVKNVLSNIACGRYIQISSCAVYKKHQLDLKEEMMDTSKEHFELSDTEQNYGVGKRYAESAALQLYPEIATTIVRIPFVVETDNLDNKELNMRLFFYAEHIVKQMPMRIDNPDYCCAFIRTTEEADFLSYLSGTDYRGVINMSSEGYVTVGQIVQYIEAKSGKKAVYSEQGDLHPFRPEHFGNIGFSFNLERAKTTGYHIAKLDSWIWKLLDNYVDMLMKEK